MMHAPNRKVVAALLACAVVSIGALTGCSSSGTDSGKVTLTIWAKGSNNADPQSAAAENWMLSEYKKTHPNVSFQQGSFSTDGERLQKLQAAALTNTLPDIAQVGNEYFGSVVQTGKVRDLGGIINPGDYAQGAQRVVKQKDGKNLGVLEGTNTMAIIYNKDLFSKAGITSPPKTWEEFAADGKKLKGAGVPVPFQFSAASNGCGGWQLSPWIWSAGGVDGKLTSSGTVKAVTYLGSLVNDGTASKDATNWCQSEDNFLAGTTAMIQNGPWGYAQLKQSKVNWGTFPIPTPSSSDKLVLPLGGSTWFLPSTGNSQREKAAADFLKWSQQPQIVSTYDAKLGYIPVLNSLLPQLAKDQPDLKVYIDDIQTARGRADNLGSRWGAYADALTTATQQVITGTKSVDDALASAQRDYDSSN